MSAQVVELPQQRQPEPDGVGGQFDRTPPQDVPAEQAVLGGMLLSKDACAEVCEILTGEDFYRPVHGTIFNTLVRLYGAGAPVDMVSVGSALLESGDLLKVGGGPYLHTLTERVPTAASAAWYARSVYDRAVERRLIEAGTRLVQLGHSGARGTGRSAADLATLAQQAVYEVTARSASDEYAMLADLLQPTLDEIEAIGNRKGEMSGVPTGFTDLDRLLNGLSPGQLVIIAGRPGMGKALALDTPLPTPDGWTTMGEVHAGDWLLDADGNPTRVTGAFEVRHDRPCYEVVFSDGSTIVADAEHLWSTSTRASRRSVSLPRESVVTTAQIAETLRTPTADQRANHAVHVAAALTLPERDLSIPPYTLGVWLGDGHSDAARFTTVDQAIIQGVEADGFRVRLSGPIVYAILPPALPPLSVRECLVCGVPFQPKSSAVYTCGRSCGGRSKGLPRPAIGCATCGRETGSSRSRSAARRCTDCHQRFGSLVGALRECGVLGNKHIPLAYLRASEAQRRELLAGLLDTDGTVGVSGNVQYTTTSERLADGVYELIVSLGYRCTISRKRVRGRTESSSTAYNLNFTTTDDVFRLPRKRATHRSRLRTTSDARTSLRYIVDVRPVPSVPVRCVAVDNPDHLYLAGKAMIPTHNTTIATDIIRNAAIRAKMTAAMFSLEMSKVELVMRILSAESRVPLHLLRSGNLSDDDWTKLARCMGEIADAPLVVDDTPSMNLMQIRSKAQRLKQRHDLKILAVDYLQLMSSPKGSGRSREQEVAELSRGLKLLGKELEVPVIAVSQLNRGPEQRSDKRPQLSDLRESGSLEQDADIVILMHRDDYYDPESSRAGEGDAIVAKHRNGPTDTITVAAQLHLSRFVDMAIG
ncbi:replicative DNA helicase [Micromonospora sp. NPDC049081]|uniref:replicative DNA helicase n=1 Tax=Micromonospora sp. NPDC049081 TaxID=3155150 RepID=UPI00340C2663